MDLKSRLAGYNALCSANPYPVIMINDGVAEENRGTKKFNDRELSMDNNLSPQFFRYYDLDAIFPEDWKLTIQIWHKGFISYSDCLIG